MNAWSYFFGSWLLWAFVLNHSRMSAVEFEVDGASSYKVLSRGAVYVQQDDRITVSVSGCNWFIKKVPIRFLKGGRERPLANYGIASSDSTNFYQITSFSKAEGGSTLEGRIGPGAVPFGLSDPKYIVLWYAFCSGGYLQSLEGRFVNPPMTLMGEAQYAKDFRVLAFWELQEAPPRLPKMIAFDSVPKCDLPVERTPAPAWHCTNFTLVVQEFTNCAELLLPKVILASYFFRVTGILEFRINDFRRQVSLDTFRPKITSGTLVSDMRTISSNTPFGVAGRGTSDWPRLETSMAKAHGLLPPGGKSATSRQRLNLIRIVLFAAMLAPLAWIALRKVERSKQKNRKT